MINLIPTDARHNVKVEYWVRVFSVWLVLLACACLIVGSLLVPSLILIRSQLAVYSGMYGAVSEQSDVYQELESSVSSANSIAMKLANLNNNALFTQLVSDVEDSTNGVVTIDSLSLERSGGTVESIKVTGSALSRAALVGFRNDLEAHTSFVSVELPLSNLAKDKDVPFSVVIVVSNEINQ